jgi:hypothetical protein
MYRLIFQNTAPFTGGDAPVVLGRDASCAMRLLDPGVSERHAQIERRADGYYLIDLGSANGVRINGQRVVEQRLAGGDEIELGGVALTFEIMHDLPVGRQAFDPLQLMAFAVVAVLVAGQIALFGWILSQPHPRRGRTDIVRGIRGQQREATAASNSVLSPLPPLPATQPVAVQAPVQEILNRMLRITRVDRTDTPENVTLRIQIKAQVSELRLEPAAASISVQFFAVPRKPKEILWLTVPADWENFSTRTFTAKTAVPCAGYVVRTYYQKKLQDVSAAPASLAQSP